MLLLLSLSLAFSQLFAYLEDIFRCMCVFLNFLLYGYLCVDNYSDIFLCAIFHISEVNFSLFYFSFLHSEIRFSFKFHFSFNSYFQFCNFSFWYYYFIFLYILRPRRLGHGKQGVCRGSLKGVSAINRSTGYVHRAQIKESQRSR